MSLREALESLPTAVYEGANRYDTDDEHVLHLWRDGQSWDIRLPKVVRRNDGSYGRERRLEPPEPGGVGGTDG